MFRSDYREAKKKEILIIIGDDTGITEYPFTPSRVPVWCPVCDYKAWAVLEDGVFVTHCLRACSKPVNNQIIKEKHRRD